jgi:hypothetical protein
MDRTRLTTRGRLFGGGGGEGNTVRTRTPQVRVFGSTLGAAASRPTRSTADTRLLSVGPRSWPTTSIRARPNSGVDASAGVRERSRARGLVDPSTKRNSTNPNAERLGQPRPKPASGVYIDRKGVKRRTTLPAKFALSSALGSPRSSPETDPVARIASARSPRCAACSMSASESLNRARGRCIRTDRR